MLMWAFCLAAVLFHLSISVESLGDFRQIKELGSQLLLKANTQKDQRVEEEFMKLQMQNYKLICGGMVHILFPLLLYGFHAAITMPSFFTVGQFCIWLVTYTHHLTTAKEIVLLTRERLKVSCYVIHISVLLLMLIATAAPDLMRFCSMQPFLATARVLLLGFVDRSVSIPFHIVYCAVEVCTYLIVLQDMTPTSMASILLANVTFSLGNIFASCILDLWVRSRIEALLQTADAESLLSSFRRMLRGVCDGEVLLDDQLKIFGESECVQHLIMTTVSMAGKPLAHFLVEEERQRFTDFIHSTTVAEASLNVGAPVCLRLSFRGAAGIRVATDIYHVPVPGLYGARKPFHLIAFKEDMEGRPPPEAPASQLLQG